MIDMLTRPRSLVPLLAISILLGASYGLTMLPISLIAGSGPFWEFPRGTLTGSDHDLADVLVGYSYLMRAPWSLPVLRVQNLAPPDGTNIFWLDAVPWLSLVGKAIFSATGIAINLLGIFVLACFVLPGAAMTVVLAAAGQRHFLAALSGTTLTMATPYLLFRWGHPALMAHFLIIVALALYLIALRRPEDRRVATTWIALLAITLLDNLYVFVMVGGIWSAALAQRGLSRTVSRKHLIAEGFAAVGLVIFTALVTGILTPDLRSAGKQVYGVLSMNLVSPFIPQMSGMIPPLAQYRVGHVMQYEGFAWLGMGVLLLLLIGARSSARWIVARGRSHIALIAILTVYLLFALSNRVFLGHRLLLDIPLPNVVLQVFGTFRSSGRFFWPIGYALVAIGILTTLRSLQPKAAILALGFACAIQVIDVEPLRYNISASAAAPRALMLDRNEISRIVNRSSAVEVFPTYGCVETALEHGAASLLSREEIWALVTRDNFNTIFPRSPSAVQEYDAAAWRNFLATGNMELQLITAHANIPINSVYNARLETNCAREEASIHMPLRRGVAYFYLTTFMPRAEQLHDHDVNSVCRREASLTWCLVPEEAAK
ncbi:MAG: hypothetical protein EXR07_18060 [Acetobacteraceae bacterium]|nr:hypothetical protein [Acetobacteraceae bacterium]